MSRLPEVAPTLAAVDPSQETQQSWVDAYLWNIKKRKRVNHTVVLLDSGADGGNYASADFVHSVERTVFGGRNITSKKGRGFLRAANPTDSDVAPMSVVGTAMLALVFPPVGSFFAFACAWSKDFRSDWSWVPRLCDSTAETLTLTVQALSNPPALLPRVPLLSETSPRNPRPWRDCVQTLSEGQSEDKQAVGWSAGHVEYNQAR